jgi:predicted ATPase/DNA-binding CsgD family transcriptional regulator
MTVPAVRRERSNLPADTTSFVGRRREVAEAKRLLADTRLLTLTGVGGVGKTRLALRVAADVLRAFPDGVWFVELAAVAEGDLLVRSVIDVLGVSEGSSRPPADILSDYLADRQVLLVLDNCEHLLDACAMLTGRLLRTAPRLRILATSRQALGVGGEYLMEVPPLSVPDADPPSAVGLAGYEAVTLFADRARTMQAGFVVDADNGEMVARLCRHLDGIPLAIELAAVRLRALSLEQIVDRLGDRFQLLTGGTRTQLERQRTLRATIDWSADLCSEQERLLWARLSVFAGDFDLEAAEEICSGSGIAPEAVLDLVAGLVDKSILVSESPGPWTRYRLLETIRQYGREMLASTGQEPALRRRHRDWYRRLARQAEADWATPRQADWFSRRLVREFPNLRVALDYCLTEPGEASVALEIAGALWCLWFSSGSFNEGRHWLERALAMDPEPSPARAKALWVGGWFAAQQGDVAAGLRMLDESRALAGRLGDESALAWATLWTGHGVMVQGDFPRAVELMEEGLAGHRRLADWTGIIVALYLLAQAMTFQGDPGGIALAEECLSLCAERDAAWGQSYALWVLGLARWRQGELEPATAAMRESLRLRRTLNERLGIAVTLEVLAWLAAAAGQAERAARLLGAAQMFRRSIGVSRTRLEHFTGPHEQCEARARKALGDRDFSAALQAGRQLTVDQAFAEALGERADAAAPASAAAARTDDGPARLTRRESEIAELIAQGLSNKQIAAKLVIAPRTAEAHVEHILTKLGFTARTQIAAWVSEHRDEPPPQP